MIISNLIVKLTSLAIVALFGIFALLAALNRKHDREIEESYFSGMKKKIA